MSSKTMIAAILVRGTVNMSADVKKTLEYLRLHKKHVCVVLEDTEATRGMLERVKDYITFGIVDETTFKKLLEKRGELLGKSKLGEKRKADIDKIASDYFSGKIKLRDFESMGLKPYFRLHPPQGGFERGGIKKAYTVGGVLGNRKEKISDLLVKML